MVAFFISFSLFLRLASVRRKRRYPDPELAPDAIPVPAQVMIAQRTPRGAPHGQIGIQPASFA
jgi:hypothetical protein